MNAAAEAAPGLPVDHRLELRASDKKRRLILCLHRPGTVTGWWSMSIYSGATNLIGAHLDLPALPRFSPAIDADDTNSIWLGTACADVSAADLEKAKAWVDGLQLQAKSP